MNQCCVNSYVIVPGHTFITVFILKAKGSKTS